MKAAPLVLLGVTCLAAALVAPGLPTDAAGPPASKGSASLLAARPGAEPAPRSWGGETTLTRQPDGHFYADVMIDGKASRMLVDTGASTIALTGADAASMGLSWRADEIRPIAQGANGAVYGLDTTLDSVRIGDVELHDVRAMIIPEGLAISLLGQSFLGRLDHVEMGPDTMVLAT